MASNFSQLLRKLLGIELPATVNTFNYRLKNGKLCDAFEEFKRGQILLTFKTVCILQILFNFFIIIDATLKEQWGMLADLLIWFPITATFMMHWFNPKTIIPMAHVTLMAKQMLVVASFSWVWLGEESKL